ncbi:MAG: threonine/serine exporter family protein [Gemmiger sp.]|nr:threonine/serine exporter family protein [Gemmiger sp.]
MTNPLGLLAQFGAAALATVCFSVLFGVQRRHFWACGLTGAVGWLAYLAATGVGASPAMATFLAALPLTLLARVFAIHNKAPVTLFLLCGIFPLVPGAGIYYTAYYFLLDDRLQCLNRGVETLKIAVGLAVGIALVSSLPMAKKRG